ncbi:helix-turn-helix transcriptional regulator [Rubrobacter tropicus]|uniref:Helix-turn-helix transcriptional regulator n=1 Tax=Rubrobacter tropicus TaxID=2653851 RepID=A0A6G8Q9Z9_9ACTN|nr:LuxR C-terminal-related transcriptional regulator [Rubrobacter tropicus]QIN83279.1 helix-turn-helix transcriptional regulator [Rubrobacter tropicus]
MLAPILATKLYVPPAQHGAVLRPRLIGRLNEGLHRRLTLVCAPAGFGKTTLIGEWIAGCGRPAAWLSLEEGDGDPARFLAYLVAALRAVAAGIGEGILDALRSPQPPPTEPLLTALLNEIAAVEDDFFLVLDDYHLVDAKAVDDAIAFLLEHVPPEMHLIIATREDPRLPLARLRARGQLSELRAGDLRFNPSEAAAFLKGEMGLDLSAEDIAALETRTEGWIAGLQLAALSMRGREDVSGFIRAFAGDNRFVVDYLVEEVLQRQPERIRSFLLRTSILERLSGALCDAVTGQEEGSGMLEVLERGNFFVVPLDDKRHWFRYHHLFADVLFAHLMAERPDQVPTLHRRASEWYEQNGLRADAIRHALAAEDFERAADLVELAVPAMRRSRQEATLLAWLKALPDELFHVRPVLNVHYAGTLLQSGELDGVEARLRDAERWLDESADLRGRPEASSARMVVMHEGAYRRLPGSIAMYRAGLALVLGDVPESVTYARRALDLATEDDHFRRGAAAALLGLASWTNGDLEAAHRSYADGMAHLQMAGYISDAVGGSIALADIRIAQGRLREAMRTYEHALHLAAEQGEPVMRGTADMYVGMGEIHRERNDLEAATQHLLRSKEQGEHTGFPQNPYRWHVAMARIQEAEGDLDGALDLLQEAERLYVSDFYPNVRPIAALKARVWAAQGRLGEALDWAREKGPSVEDDLSYVREFEHITLARVLIAEHRCDRADRSILEATGLLQRLLQAAEEGERPGRVIEILVLQALAHHVQGDTPAALVPLERALTLAEPEGYVRVFVDEGRPMARLLFEAAAHGILPDYAGRLLAALEAEEDRSEDQSHPPPALPAQSLAEPLSQRELEVLRLIAQGLSNREIGERLFLALITVKGHNRNIFRKLQVRRRTEAVARARELGLL